MRCATFIVRSTSVKSIDKLANKYATNCQLANKYATNCQLANKYETNYQLVNKYATNCQLANKYATNCQLANKYAPNCQLDKYATNCQLAKNMQRIASNLPITNLTLNVKRIFNPAEIIPLASPRAARLLLDSRLRGRGPHLPRSIGRR